MKQMIHRHRVVRWALCAGLGWLALAGAAEAAYLVLQGGNRIDGRGVRLNARGDYVIETAAGSRTYPAAQVIRAEADKPDGYDQAIAAANAGQHDQAITALTAIARRTRGLGWDDRSHEAIARIQTRRGRFAEAVDAFEAMSAERLAQPDLQPQYWKGLLESGEYAKLHALLEPAIRDGDRALAARAQLLRGDAQLKQRMLEAAVLDYLRTVTLFKAVREVQPEALYKAGTTLEEMRHAKAEDMFDTLIREYPQSEYAQQAQNR